MGASPEPKMDFLNLFTGNIFKSVYPIRALKEPYKALMSLIRPLRVF